LTKTAKREEEKVKNKSYGGMDAIRWGKRGTRAPTISESGDMISYVPLTFFSLGFVFGEVSKIKVTFATFCVKSFS